MIVEVYGPDLLSLLEDLTHQADLCTQLERAWLRFSQVRLVVTMKAFPICEDSIWVLELRKRFPALFQRGALAVVPNAGSFNALIAPR